MAIVVGQDTWATVVEADAYLTNKVGATNWFELSEAGIPGEESKESFLVSAFRWLLGSPEFLLSPSMTGDAIKNGQIEAAAFLMENYKTMAARAGALYSGVVQADYSKRKEVFDLNNVIIPLHIRGWLRDYRISSSFVLMSGEYDI